jgi:hypothetical protein
MQVWCRRSAIGDIADEHCGLHHAYCGFKALQESLPKLWSREFDGLSGAALWDRLDTLLYVGDDDRTVEECRQDWERYGQFNFLTNWREQFDGNGKSFIFCSPAGVVWILNQSLPNGISCEVQLADVQSAIGEYLAWFEREQRRLAGDH